MRVLWNSSVPLSARTICDSFPTEGPTPALTTILTVLDRLSTKGVVTKSPLGASGAVFAATHSEPTFVADAMESALHSSSDRSAALLRFAGSLGSQDADLLRRALGPEE
ncbi:transcriptional regulator [Cryobacterium sp. TMB1-7]|nr:transcriptional regulator [Cryobacterium sp. TMB1-7]TFC90019.1 transcriptional regulator [Cryobacterium sp. TMT4-31]